MQSRCSRRRCNWILEVVHMDEALDQLRQHYRAVHPTKFFSETNEAANLEGFNVTADEFMENYNIGSDEAPQYDWRHLRAQVARYRQDVPNDRYINLEALDEVDRRVQENDANQPPEAAPAAAVADGALPFVRWDVAPEYLPPAFDADGNPNGEF